jgi:hypothetical protein
VIYDVFSSVRHHSSAAPKKDADVPDGCITGVGKSGVSWLQLAPGHTDEAADVPVSAEVSALDICA